MSDLSAGFYLNLGQRLREARRKAGLHQSAVAREMGFKSNTGQVFISRLEHGKAAIVTLGAVVRYLQACKVPVGEFVLELAQSGAFGAAEAESVVGFVAQKPTGETSNEEAKRAKSKLLHEKRREREARDADIVARLWREVQVAMQPLLPPDPTRFMGHYFEVVRDFYRAWKLTTRGAGGPDATQAVQLVFDRIEQNAREHLVPAAVRKMREVVLERLTATSRGEA